jgi:hypothetical protein
VKVFFAVGLAVWMVRWLVRGWRDPERRWILQLPEPGSDTLRERLYFALTVGLIFAFVCMIVFRAGDDGEPEQAPTSEVTPATDPPLR